MDPPAVAAAPVPLWRRLPIGSIILVALIAAGGIGALLFNAGRDASGEINRQGDLEASELRVGDCFDFKDPDAEEFDTVTAVPCGAEHEYELFFAGAMPSGTYPTDAVMNAFVEANCTEAFVAYVGKSYADSVLEIAWTSPTAELWNLGDRVIQCSVYHPQIPRLTESMKGSAQ